MFRSLVMSVILIEERINFPKCHTMTPCEEGSSFVSPCFQTSLSVYFSIRIAACSLLGLQICIFIDSLSSSSMKVGADLTDS